MNNHTHTHKAEQPYNAEEEDDDDEENEENSLQ